MPFFCADKESETGSSFKYRNDLLQIPYGASLRGRLKCPFCGPKSYVLISPSIDLFAGLGCLEGLFFALLFCKALEIPFEFEQCRTIDLF